MNFLENVKIIQKPKKKKKFGSKKVIIFQFIGLKKKFRSFFFVQMGALTKFKEKLGPKA